MADGDRIVQTVELEGADRVEQQFGRVGRAGERAFDDMQRAADRANLDNVARQTDRLGDATERMAGQARTAAGGVDQLGDSVDDLGGRMRRAEGQVSSFGDTLGSLVRTAAVVGGSLASLGAGIFAAAQRATTLTEKVRSAAHAAQLSTKTYQEFNGILRALGVSSSEVTEAINTLTTEAETKLTAAGRAVEKLRLGLVGMRFAAGPEGMDDWRDAVARAANRARGFQIDAKELQEILTRFKGDDTQEGIIEFQNAIGELVNKTRAGFNTFRGLVFASNNVSQGFSDSERTAADFNKEIEGLKESFEVGNFESFIAKLAQIKNVTEQEAIASRLLGEGLGTALVGALRGTEGAANNYRKALEGVNEATSADEDDIKVLGGSLERLQFIYNSSAQAAAQFSEFQGRAVRVTERAKNAYTAAAQALRVLQKDNTTENLINFGEALLTVTDRTDQMELAIRGLGSAEAAGQFLEGLEDTDNAIRKIIERRKKFRLGFSDDDIASGRKFAIAMFGLSDATNQSAVEFARLFRPATTRAIDLVTDALRNQDGLYSRIKDTLRQSVVPAVDDFIKLLSGADKTEIKSEGAKRFYDVLTAIGRVAQFVFDEVIIPGFKRVEQVVGGAIQAINKFFGTDFDASSAGVLAAIGLLIGGFNSLALAIAALFLGGGPEIDKFKEKLKSIGIDVDRIGRAIKETLLAAWEAVLAAFDQKPNMTFTERLEAGLKSVPGIILQIIGGLLLLRKVAAAAAAGLGVLFGKKISGDALIGAVAIGQLSGALDALRNLAIIAGIAVVFLEKVLIAIAALTGALPLLAFGLALVLINIDKLPPVLELVVRLLKRLGVDLDAPAAAVLNFVRAIFDASRALDEFLGLSGRFSTTGALDAWIQGLINQFRFLQSVVRDGFLSAVLSLARNLSAQVTPIITEIINRQIKLFTVDIPNLARQAGQLFVDIGKQWASALVDPIIKAFTDFFTWVQERFNTLKGAPPPGGLPQSGQQETPSLGQFAVPFGAQPGGVVPAMSELDQHVSEVNAALASTPTSITTTRTALDVMAAAMTSIASQLAVAAESVSGSVGALSDLASAAASAAEQLARIQAPGTPGRASGGPIYGPGTSTSDSILARLSRGEYVVRAAAVRKYGSAFMDSINQGRFARGGSVWGALPRFATGGDMPFSGTNRFFMDSTIYRVDPSWAYDAAKATFDAASLFAKGITSFYNRGVQIGKRIVQEELRARGRGRFASGGLLAGPGTSTSDSILARLSRGEYVMRAAAVGKYGTAFMDAVNSMQMPSFADGGMTTPIRAPRPPTEGATPPRRTDRGLTLVLDGNRFDQLSGPEGVVDGLESYAVAQQHRQAGRPPRWRS